MAPSKLVDKKVRKRRETSSKSFIGRRTWLCSTAVYVVCSMVDIRLSGYLGLAHRSSNVF